MPYLRTLGALVVALLIITPAHAAEPMLRVRQVDDTIISIRYEGLAKTDRLQITDAKGAVVKTATVSKSRGTKEIRLPDTLQEGAYTLQALGRDGTVRATNAFTYDVPAPSCTMTVSDKTPEKRDTITLRWKMENADFGYVFGNRKVEGNGSERVSLYHAGKRGFSLNVFGKGGAGSCAVMVQVQE